MFAVFVPIKSEEIKYVNPRVTYLPDGSYSVDVCPQDIRDMPDKITARRDLVLLKSNLETINKAVDPCYPVNIVIVKTYIL